MNKGFMDGFEKTAIFSVKHNVSIDNDMKKFLSEEIAKATKTLKPRIGAGTIFGGALVAGLGLAAGDYIASLFKSPADRTVGAVNKVSPVQFGTEGDQNEKLRY